MLSLSKHGVGFFNGLLAGAVLWHRFAAKDMRQASMKTLHLDGLT
jgi:hypothetical protein